MESYIFMSMEDSKAFYKGIKNILLPKFPFIKDVRVDGGIDYINNNGRESNIFTVTYVIETDENKEFTVTEDFAKIEELTFTLFKMFGFNSNKKLIVTFSSE